jgi:hypothetical protein
MTEQMFDLRLADGDVVQWPGTDGENAARRYVDCHRDAAVVAWRNPSAAGTVTVLGDTRRIIG